MDDVLEMAEMLLRTRNTDALALVQTVEAIAAEVRELRAKLDSEASHRLSLCADNERFVAEIERLRDREVEIVAARARDYREFGQAQSEIERLRADLVLVWAVEHHCKHVISVVGDGIEWASPVGSIMKSVEEWDPDSICRAVRSARTGE